MAGNKGNKKGQKLQTGSTQQTTAKKDKPSKKSNQTSKSTQKSSCSCCKWTIGIFIVIGAIVAAICYDVTKNGDGVFEKSAVGKVLKDTGALPYVEVATTKTLHYSACGYQWAEINIPIAYNTTKEHVTPTCRFLKDLGIVIWNGIKQGFSNLSAYIKLKIPVVTNFIEQYAPGLTQKIADLTISTWSFVCDLTIKIYKASFDFFKTKVFTGQLSPENLGKALNTTQFRAAEYYSWFHQKVDHYAKIKSS